MEAARSGQTSLVALLLEHDAQVDMLTKVKSATIRMRCFRAPETIHVVW